MQKSYQRILQSLVAIPVLAANLALVPISGTIGGLPTVAAIFPDQTRTLSSEVTLNPEPPHLIAEAAKIDAYLAKRNSPLVGQGLHLAKTSEENGFDYRVLTAVVTIESNAGLMACKKDPENIGGYMSCKGIDFDSYEEAIDVIGRTLGAKIPSSAYHYEGKTLKERLVTYNGNANSLYWTKINAVMNQIDKMEVPSPTTVATTTPSKV